MSENKFTPGPWLITANGCHVYGAMKGYPDCADKYVCTLAHNAKERANPDLAANAHLIAAAPEMYEALKELREFMRKHDVFCPCHEDHAEVCPIAKAEAALKKASGQ